MRHRAEAVWLILMMLLSGSTAVEAAFLVPKAVTGELGYRFGYADDGAGMTTTTNTITAGINSNAYIWQPWFATLGMSLDLSQIQSSSSNGADSSNDFAVGNLTLSVLPMSIYPFTAQYQVSDSRIDSSSANDNPLLARSTASHFTRNHLQLTQGILGNLYRFKLRYEHDEAESSLGETNIQEGYGVEYSLRALKQNLSAKAEYKTQSNDQSNIDGDNFIAMINHSYYPTNYTTVDTQVSHVDSDNTYINDAVAGLTTRYANTIEQVTTRVGWRSASKPLRVNGSMRIHKMDYLTDNGTTATSNQMGGVYGTLGASYQFSDRLRSTLSGNYNVERDGGSDHHAHSENAGVNYSSDRYNISEFDYSWNGGLSGSNQVSEEVHAQSLTLSLGHSASRGWRLRRQSRLRLSLNQSIQESYNRGTVNPLVGGNVNEKTRRLSSGATLGWMSNDSSGNSMAQLSLTDSRGILGDKDITQMLNAQVSRQQSVSNRSRLNGNLTWQATHNIQEGLPDYGISSSASASASYQYARPFSLQQVNFASNLRFSSTQPAVGTATEETFWENRLNHEIGRVYSSVILSMREHLGTRSSMLMLTVKRTF